MLAIIIIPLTISTMIFLVLILFISVTILKVIDFGTSCYEGSSQSKAPDYVQTRYYRAPEVPMIILTIPTLDLPHLDHPHLEHLHRAGDHGCGLHRGGGHVESWLHRGGASHWQTHLSWGS